MSDINVLLEGFGAPLNENLLADDTDPVDVAQRAIDELDDYFGLDNIATIVTGMNTDFTHNLEDLLEDTDVEVEPFYPNITNIMEEDDLEYQDAWKQGFTWRNNKVLINDEDDDDQTVVDLVVRLGDAGDNGQELLRHARRKGVNNFDINADDMIDRDAAYGDTEADAEAAA